MARFEIQGPDGKTYEVEAPDMQSAVSALQSVAAPTAGGVAPDTQATSELESRLKSFGEGGASGLALGWFDNIDGAIDATTESFSGDGSTWGERYARNRDQRRDIQGERREAHPGVYGAGEIAGGAVTSMAAAPHAANTSIPRAMATMSGVGAVEGALVGGGMADGQDVAKNAAIGGAVGAGVGALAVPAVAGGKAITRHLVENPVAGIVDTLLGRASPRRANNVMQKAVERSGMSADELAQSVASAATDGQDMFRLMDAMGPSGQATASGIARTPGAAQAELRDFLQSRQANAGDRMSQHIAEGFDAPDTATQRRTALTADRKATADVEYADARGNAAPVDVRGALGIIDTRLAPYEGSGVVGDGIDGIYTKYRNRLAADMVPSDVDAIELSDFDRVLGIKQDISDDIEAAIRAGRGNEARELTKVRDALDAALEESSGAYRQANDNFATASRNIDAIDEGSAMAAPRQRQTDTTERFGNMTPDQQDAARAGYADSLIAKSEAQTSGSNRAGPLLTDKRQAEIAEMATDAPLLQRQIDRENTMFETRNRAVGGSQTANNMQDIDDVAPFDVGMIANLLGGNWKTAGTQMAQKGVNTLTGRNEATQQLIARALLSKDPQAALAPVIQQATRSERSNRLIEALLRHSGQQALNN